MFRVILTKRDSVGHLLASFFSYGIKNATKVDRILPKIGTQNEKNDGPTCCLFRRCSLNELQD